MKTSADLAHDYLSAVGRETSALPADRRQELLADLAEHIEVTRAERPDLAIGEILAGLGDPRTIAATALAEAGSGTAGAPARTGDAAAPARRGTVHPLVPLLLLTVPYLAATLLPDLTAVQVCSTLFRLVGAVLLCTSVHWVAPQKTTGVLVTVGLTLAISVWNLSSDRPVGPTPALVANLAALALLAGTSAWLWRVRRV
ncbi:HAAS signaling domain-containing protein [Streptomyces sp. NPDC088789]|uniref:HAAS signaling domain-containing protein n=1 Tax=Streptomyces sp. NPDC088789 TaxID=3365899 RepID=UPI00380530AE